MRLNDMHVAVITLVTSSHRLWSRALRWGAGSPLRERGSRDHPLYKDQKH